MEVFFSFLSKDASTTLRPKIVLKNITKTCVCSFVVSRVFKMSSECHCVIVLNFQFFGRLIRYIEEVIVIEKLRVTIRKAIRCALTLQQSQFSTISGPTLTTTSSIQKNVDCKKEMLRQRHLNVFECSAHHATQVPAFAEC